MTKITLLFCGLDMIWEPQFFLFQCRNRFRGRDEESLAPPFFCTVKSFCNKPSFGWYYTIRVFFYSTVELCYIHNNNKSTFTKHNRFSTADFLWRHDTTCRQELIDKKVKTRQADCFHDNTWHSSKVCIKMKKCEDEKQSPC